MEETAIKIENKETFVENLTKEMHRWLRTRCGRHELLRCLEQASRGPYDGCGLVKDIDDVDIFPDVISHFIWDYYNESFSEEYEIKDSEDLETLHTVISEIAIALSQRANVILDL